MRNEFDIELYDQILKLYQMDKLKIEASVISRYIQSNIDQIINSFYQQIKNDGEALAFFKNLEQIIKMQAANKDGFVQIFSPPFDIEYCKRNIEMIGRVHFKNNIPIKKFVEYQNIFFNIISDFIPSELHPATATILQFNTSCIFVSYYSESIKKVSHQNQEINLFLSTIAHDISGPLVVFGSQIRNISKFAKKLSESAKTISNISASVKRLMTDSNTELYTEKLEVNVLMKNIIEGYKSICDINNQDLITTIDKPCTNDTLVTNEPILVL